MEIDKERKVNAANLENITNQKKTIEDLKEKLKRQMIGQKKKILRLLKLVEN